MRLVLISAGKFLMGSPASENDRRPDETQHEVKISKAFYMGVTPVTEDQYAQFLKDTGQTYVPGGCRPVVDVTWVDAQAFCAWLSQKTGKAVLLPTEAQWEYACRAGSTTAYYFGDDYTKLHEYAYYRGNRINGSRTQPVGQKKPNG